MWKWRFHLLFLSSIFVLVGLVFFVLEPNGKKMVEMSQQGQESLVEGGVEQVLSDTHLIKSQGAGKLWELKAEQVSKQKDSSDWYLEKVDVQFFGENSVSYKAVGDRGFVDNDGNHLRMKGDIQIHSSNGYTLTTPVILYNANARKIEGPRLVQLTGLAGGEASPLFVKGDFFNADLETNIINLRQNVNGRKKISGNRLMKIASREAVFSGQSMDVLFQKKVVIRVESMAIRGPRARFKYENGELDSLLVDGGVRIEDLGRWGRADEVQVFFREDKYVLRGAPKVVQGEDQVKGDEISIYDGGNRVRVKKAKTKYNTKDERKIRF